MKNIKKKLWLTSCIMVLIAVALTGNIHASASEIMSPEEGWMQEVPDQNDFDQNDSEESDSEEDSESNQEGEEGQEEPENGDVLEPDNGVEEKENYDSYFENVSMQTDVIRAVGTKYQLKLSNIALDEEKYKCEFKTANAKIAKVDSNGLVTMIATGRVDVKAVITCDNGAVYTYTCSIRVTNPKFSSDTYFVKKNGTVTAKVSGGSTSKYTIKVHNEAIVVPTTAGGNKFKGLKYGRSKLSVTMDGKTISCYVYVSAPKLNYTDVFVLKGKSIQLKVSGHSKATNITYSTSDKSVATVSKTGKVSTKKNGSCIITVSVDGKKLQCYVAASNKKVINTIKEAYSKIGYKYSQAKRMQKNYFDCSSFIWRCYSKNGVKFGASSYAPTAAGEAYNMVKTKKALYYKGVTANKLLPGDVLFVKNSKKNGRYKNIGHVVMYIGNGRIIHSTPPKVRIDSYTRYLYSKKNPYVLVARPTK